MTVIEMETRFREAIAKALYRPARGGHPGYVPFNGSKTHACIRCGAAVANTYTHTAWHDSHGQAHDEG